MTDFYRIELAALDGFEMAVTRFDADGVLTYLNAAGASLFGVSPSEYTDLRMLFPDSAEFELVTGQLRERFQGRSSAYATTFTRPNARPGELPIPVSVYAFPDSDERGIVKGSVAMLRDLREEQARAGIHNAIKSSVDNAQLFAAVAEQLRPLLEFDEFRITTISKSRMHLRRMYSTDARAGEKFPFRWWPMPPFIRETLADRVAGVVEVEAILANPHYIELLKHDKAHRDFMESGVRQILSLPVVDHNRIVAMIGLDSHKAGRFTADSVALLARLPLAEAVMAAIHREQSIQQQAVFDLIRRLSAHAIDVRRVADELVSCLVESFGWRHVSIFQSEGEGADMRLVCQANEGVALPPDFSLPCTAPSDNPDQQHDGGVLGRAARSQQVVNMPESRLDGPFGCIVGFAESGSELAVPVTGSRTNWVLNVESEMLNAFAAEEIELLELLAHEAGAVLHRSALFEMQTAVLRSINDAVIETNLEGRVRWSNVAARNMLGIDPRTAGVTMRDLVVDEPVRAALERGDSFHHIETSLRGADDRMVPVLLSASTLPDHLSGRVYVASDFTFQKELQRLSELSEVFRHAAMEGRVPLALASTWLQQLNDGERPTPDMVDKVLSQMARADLPLERLLRLFSPPTAEAQAPEADLDRALASALAELPRSLLEAIDCQQVGKPMLVGADFEDLHFCIESMLSFGLRTRPQSKHLRVRTTCADGWASFEVVGDWTLDATSERAPGPTERWRRKTLCDLTLGESVIERILDKAGGTYKRRFDQGFTLAIAFPLKA